MSMVGDSRPYFGFQGAIGWERVLLEILDRDGRANRSKVV